MIWTPEAAGAWLACAIDTDGWVGMRSYVRGEGGRRIDAYVGITNQSQEIVERFAVLAGVPRRMHVNGRPGADERKVVSHLTTWQGKWTSPPHLVRILESAMPYLTAKQERAQIVLEYAYGRITSTGQVARSSQPYQEADFMAAATVKRMNTAA